MKRLCPRGKETFSVGADDTSRVLTLFFFRIAEINLIFLRRDDWRGHVVNKHSLSGEQPELRNVSK